MHASLEIQLSSKTAPWKPLDITVLPECQIVACDPSLTALGVVWLGIDGEGVTIHGAEKLGTAPTERKGWDDTFARAALMEALVDALFDGWFDSFSMINKSIERDDIVAVHELPPTGGGDFVRTEAATLSGYAFRRVAKEYQLPVLQGVTPQSHKKLISGNHLAKKKEHHEELKKLLPKILGGYQVTNEATRDALSIALYAAKRIGNEAE